MKQSIAHCIFFCLFRTNLCSCLSFSLYFHMFAYVCLTTEWSEFSSCSLPLNTWYPTQITHMENKVIPILVYGLRTGKKLYCIRMCICQSSDKFQGFKSTPHLVTSNSNSGRLLWEKILRKMKRRKRCNLVLSRKLDLSSYYSSRLAEQPSFILCLWISKW